MLIGFAILATAAGLGVYMVGPSNPPQPVATTAPNLVVILGCTLRRDQLGPWGAPPEVTPFLDQQAGAGTVFDDAIASSSWTKESSTAIFTGRQAASVGMIDPGPQHSSRVLADPVQTLAERLLHAGYDTLGVTANPHLNTTWGLAQGFERYHDTTSTGFKRKDRIHAEEVVDLALEMLSERPDPDRPFYLRLVMIDPHAPLDIPPQEIARQQHPEVPARIARYRAGVHRVDRALERLNEALIRRGHTPQNTLFVLVTDHGEGLSTPAHHRAQHGRVLYESLTSVPWLLRGLDVAAGHRVPGLASHLDVTPTLLSLLGQPADPTLLGHDWSDRVRGDTRPTDRTVAYSETWYFGAARAARFTDDQACQLDFGSTEIRNNAFQPGCFDRAADPDWTTPTQDTESLDALRAWRAEQQTAYDQWPHTEDADHGVGQTRRQLEALGYVE